MPLTVVTAKQGDRVIQHIDMRTQYAPVEALHGRIHIDPTAVRVQAQSQIGDVFGQAAKLLLTIGEELFQDLALSDVNGHAHGATLHRALVHRCLENIDPRGIGRGTLLLLDVAGPATIHDLHIIFAKPLGLERGPQGKVRLALHCIGMGQVQLSHIRLVDHKVHPLRIFEPYRKRQAVDQSALLLALQVDDRQDIGGGLCGAAQHPLARPGDPHHHCHTSRRLHHAGRLK